MEKGKGRVSFFEAPISNTKPGGELSLEEVHRLITGEKYKVRTGQLRALADKGKARKYKAANFDYCTFSGVFGLRANHALVEHSGLLCMDLDHLPDVAKMKKRLLADPLFDTQLLFVSPSGDGLKWVVPIDLSRASHEVYFEGVAHYLLVCYGVEADKSGRDVSRACFLPYDPEAFLGSGGEGGGDASAFNPKSWLPGAGLANGVAAGIRSGTENGLATENGSATGNGLQVGCSAGLGEGLQTKYGADSEDVPQLGEEVKLEGVPQFEDVPQLGEEVKLEDVPSSFFSDPKGGLPTAGSYAEIEAVTQRIERAAVDIAPTYPQWRDLGFALTEALGEGGRGYYHRLSRFYADYRAAEADRQFDRCLRSRGSGITVKTFFHLALQAGVDVNTTGTDMCPASIDGGVGINMAGAGVDVNTTVTSEFLPVFPQSVYEHLPRLLRDVAAKADSPQDADLLLLGSLATISACLPKVYGIYDKREVFPNLFLFVAAQASAGKGRLTLCRRIVEPVHRQLRKMAEAEYAEYQCALAEYALDKHKSEADKPMEPPLRLLFIPANTSATGMLQLLNDNAGRGLMFETEGDTLAQAFKQEYGNYSDSFRKAFHHETIAYNRRKDREYVEIKKPCLSAVLSGTPKQIKHLIPDVENGLFSRFLFYNLEISPVWKNVFAEDEDETLDDYFEQIGERFYDLYRLLERETDSLRFCFTRNQEKQFSEFFDRMHKKYYTLYGGEFVSSIRRLGLMTFRMAMIMTTLRIMDDGDLKTLLVCSDTDFQTVIRMAEVIVQHTREVYLEFFSSDAASDADDAEAGGRWKQPVISRVYFENLPFEFNRQTYLATASRMNIKPKTAEKYIRNFCKLHRLVHTGYDNYRKAAVTLRR